MRKYTVIISFLLSLLATFTIYAQPNKYGVPIITNYKYHVTGGEEQNWCITQDSRGVMYIGNNNKGVLEYDGVEWRSIPIPNNPIVRSLVTGDDGVVYVGAEAEFGRLEPDGFGKMHYHSLSDTINQEIISFSSVWKTYYIEGKVYYCSFDKLFVYTPEADELVLINGPKDALFSFFIDSSLYIGDYANGLMKYEQDSFVTVSGGEHFRQMNISGIVKFDSTRLLLGTFIHGLFLLDREKGTVENDFVEPSLNEYLKKGVILYLHPVNKDFVVTTQFSGLVIIDGNGEAREIITEAEGMIDQTTPYVYSNDWLTGSGPVWIAHFQGVSKLETNNPFRIFTERSGFEGFITDIKIFNNDLVISTFAGLYYKSSTSTGTKFISIPEIQDQIWQLHVFKPSPGKELLLAIAQSEIYVIDENMNVSTIRDRIVNPPDSQPEQQDYGGHQIVADPNRPDVVYTGWMDIIGLQYKEGRWREIMRVKNLPEERLKMVIDRDGYLWSNSRNRGVICIDISNGQDRTPKYFNVECGLPSNEKNQVIIDPNSREVLLGTVDGLYRCNYFRNSLYRDTTYNKVLPHGKNHIIAFHKDLDGDYWISFENEFQGWTEMVFRESGTDYKVIREKSFQRLPNASADVFFSDPEKGVWFSKSNELYHFDKSFVRYDTVPFRTLIRNIYINNDSLLYNGTNFTVNSRGGFTIHPLQAEETQPLINYQYNNIEFRWAAPFFEQEDEMRFSFWLENFENDWSDWSEEVYQDFTNLPFGQYTMHVKAMNVYGDESVPARYAFTILRPWYATYVAIIVYTILSTLVIYLIIKLYTRRLLKENIRLEGIIEERTEEIRKQKEELTDSIEYASRIQRALLPPDRLMDKHNIDHFIFFRPRDIVSGDFYWIGSKNGKILIVVADCTGHGVPGAFMSMLGISFLDEIVIKSDITDTNKILDSLRDHVIISLKQSGKSLEETNKDGMDLAMISLDRSSHQIQFSGAYNPLYVVRNLSRSEKAKLEKGEVLDLEDGTIHDDENILKQIRADLMPIGISEKSHPFSVNTFKDEGYTIYMFSDGFLDQFGGPSGKKFKSPNFKKLILELQSIPLKEQDAALEKVLLGWMGEISQIDDILVMGLRMNPN